MSQLEWNTALIWRYQFGHFAENDPYMSQHMIGQVIYVSIVYLTLVRNWMKKKSNVDYKTHTTGGNSLKQRICCHQIPLSGTIPPDNYHYLASVITFGLFRY